MAKQLLEDVFTFVPSQILEEDAGGKKLRFVEGRVQMADVGNANKRKYPRAVLEAAINNPKTQEALREHRMLGCLDHPSDGKTTLENASHLVTDLRMTESGEVIGRWQILSTPKGMTLRALCEDGVSFGASTRCTGSLKDGPDGLKIVQNDLVWETVDAVYNPSTHGAYPKPVWESTNTNLTETEENTMAFAERFNALEQRVSKLNSIKAKSLDEGTKSIVRKELTEAMVEASRLGQEAPEYKALTESMIKSLSGRRESLLEAGGMQDGITMLVQDPADGQADQGYLRYPVYEQPPAPGDGGHIVDPNAVAIPSEMEQMITALVAEEKEEDEDEEASADEDEEERKKRKKEQQMESFAAGVVRNAKNSKASRGLAAAFLHERVRRINEANAYQRIVAKMQEKLDEAISSGKVVVESDEKLAAKYQLVQDVLKETVRRYKITEARHYAVDRLIELNLDKDTKARKFLAEAIKSNPVVTKTTIEEAITLFAKVSGIDLSKEVKKSAVPTPVTESKAEVEEKKITESVVPDAAKKELPLGDMSGKIAKLNESASDQAVSSGVALANRISRNMNISRSTPSPVKK
jgi:hypothetical protein